MAAPRRRAGRRRSDEGGNAWLTVYADMVTLLMAFFVLLYSMSTVDAAKFQALVTGLAVPFGNEAGEGLLPASDGLLEETVTALVPVEAAVDGPAPLELASSDATVDAPSSLDEVEAALERDLREAGLDGVVERRRDERGIVVSIASDDVLFALGSTAISALGHRVIETVTATLRAHDAEVLIEGHTDDLPLRRRGYTNWNLSTDRAVAVLSQMIGRHDFPPDRIGAVGYGEHRPQHSNRTAAGRAGNRRVDIVVLGQEVPT